jgi:Na+-driven multidrug efflux pump
MIIKIGTEAYAAHNIAGTIETFSYLPGMGFGVAAATLVGQNLGAKKANEAQKYGLISYILST